MATKGMLVGVRVFQTERAARRYARGWVGEHTYTRTFRRDIRVDNVALTTWVVVVRSSKATARLSEYAREVDNPSRSGLTYAGRYRG